MDDQTRITTYKESLRLIYGDATTPDLAGLRKKIAALHEEAEGSVVITASGFEGEQSSGQLVLEPLEKLNAAITLLRELDPDNVPDQPETVVFADFRSGGYLET